MNILAINPGSTSTKIGVFQDENLLFEQTMRHTAEELLGFTNLLDQYAFRKDLIVAFLKDKDFKIEDLDAIVGRGGLLHPIPGGTYQVSADMLSDLKKARYGEHASNLGGLIASEIASGIGKNAYIVDPVVVDELSDVARFSGHPAFVRKSIFHALNQKAIAKQYAADAHKNYEDLNVIVVHAGGGVSVAAHKKGRVVDVNNALDGEGAFSPERSGGLPIGSLTEMCYSGKSLKEVQAMIKGKGGLVAYLGSSDVKGLREQAQTDEKVSLILEAMAYQVAKEIGAYSVVLDGQVDAILLTGGIAYDKAFTTYIENKVKFIADVKVYPGEDELKALVLGVLRVLNGTETVKTYQSEVE